MITFFIYVGTSTDGNIKWMGISEHAEDPPEDYFEPCFTKIEKKGEVQVTGDVEYFNDYFEME